MYSYAHDVDISNNSITLTSTVNMVSDVKVTGDYFPALIVAGDGIEYIIEVENGGPSLSRNVVVSDSVPSEVENFFFSTDNGITWNVWMEV